LIKVINAAGFEMKHKERTLASLSARHLWNVERGYASLTIDKLEAVADEIGVDMLEFFKE
jgi:transcriptional regulator with XRE-family HTH domain